jgi:hypothetical protein
LRLSLVYRMLLLLLRLTAGWYVLVGAQDVSRSAASIPALICACQLLRSGYTLAADKIKKRVRCSGDKGGIAW